MAVPLTPDDATKLVTKLLDLYAQAEAALLEKIAESIQKGIDAPEWEHRQLLEIQRYRREAQATLTQLSKRAAAAGSTAVGAATNSGAATALADLNTSLAPSAAIVGNPVNLEAVASLAADLADITTTTNATILRSVDDIYRRTVADMTTQELLGTATRRELAERALQRLANAGITGFVDKAGRKWEASSYIEMASRAATMNAAIAGHTQQLQSQGHDLVMISDVPQECERCRPWEGRIVSLGGAVAGAITPDGKRVAGSLAQARADGLFHPNCRHSIAAYFPGVTKGFGETADPQGDKDRQRLRLLERRLRAAKREEAVALTPAGAQLARAKVRDLQTQIREHVATTTAKRQPHREKIPTGTPLRKPAPEHPGRTKAGYSKDPAEKKLEQAMDGLMRKRIRDDSVSLDDVHKAARELQAYRLKSGFVGQIDERIGRFDNNERQVVEKLLGENHNITHLARKDHGERTPDLLVDGVPHEIKTSLGANPTTLENRLLDAQSDRVFINSFSSKLSQEQMVEVATKLVNSGVLQYARIIGNGFDVTVGK